MTERPANLQKASKKSRDQACQLITVPALFYQNNVFEPWKDFRTKNGVALNKTDKCSSDIHKCSAFLIKIINISSEQQKCMYLYRQNYTIINQNRQNHIPLNARSWNDLKRILDSSLKKYFWRHADTNNRDWASTLPKNIQNYCGAIQPCIVYWGTTNLKDEYAPNKIVNKISWVYDSSVALSKHRAC